MGKAHQPGESGIGESLRSSLSKLTGRVSVKAPSATEPSSSGPKNLVSQPQETATPPATNREVSAPAPQSVTKPANPSPSPEAAKSTPSVRSATLSPAAASPRVPMMNKLANDVSIEGKLVFTDRLIFDGRLKGEIFSEGSLTIQQQAVIDAQIRVKSVMVEGKVVGDITATESVHLGPTARVVGHITTRSLSVEPQAHFQGQATVGKPS